MYFWSDNFENFAYIGHGLQRHLCAAFPVPGGSDTFNFLSHGHTKTQLGAVRPDRLRSRQDVARHSAHDHARRALQRRPASTATSYLDYDLPFICPPPRLMLAFNTARSRKAGASGPARRASPIRSPTSDGIRLGIARLSRGRQHRRPAHIYGPESAWSYDAGVKSRFWDDRVQFNVAAYHEEIQHLQVFIQSSTQSGINNVNGITQVNGLETEVDRDSDRQSAPERDGDADARDLRQLHHDRHAVRRSGSRLQSLRRYCAISAATG